MKKLAVIPAYNEAGNIEKTVKDIIENAPSFDYIVINDMPYRVFLKIHLLYELFL